MRNRLNDENFGILMIGIIIFTRLIFYQNILEIFLTLKYVTVFAGVFFHKSETSNDKEVYTMLSTRVKLL